MRHARTMRMDRARVQMKAAIAHDWGGRLVLPNDGAFWCPYAHAISNVLTVGALPIAKET